MTFEEATELIEQSRHKGRAAVLFGYTGGWKRYVWLSHGRDGIEVHLHGTKIATLFADGRITLRTGGYYTAMTIEALNFVLRGRGHVYRQDYKVKFSGREFVEGMTV